MNYVCILTLLCFLLYETPIKASPVISLRRQAHNASDITLPGLPANFSNISPQLLLDGISSNPQITEESLSFDVLGLNNSSPGFKFRKLSEEGSLAYRYRNYFFSECTMDQITHLKTVIDSLIEASQTAVYEAKTNGMSSSYGFGALFKSATSVSTVADMFQRIASGTGVHSSSAVQKVGMVQLPPNPPVLVCVNNGDPSTRALQKACGSGGASAQVAGTNYIILCPVLFDAPFSPLKQFCPKTINNEPWPVGPQLQLSQVTAVAHEMAHMYLNSPTVRSLAPEVYSLGDAIDLSKSDQLINASNYAFFLAAIIAKCTNWPFIPDELKR